MNNFAYKMPSSSITSQIEMLLISLIIETMMVVGYTKCILWNFYEGFSFMEKGNGKRFLEAEVISLSIKFVFNYCYWNCRDLSSNFLNNMKFLWNSIWDNFSNWHGIFVLTIFSTHAAALCLSRSDNVVGKLFEYKSFRAVFFFLLRIK